MAELRASRYTTCGMAQTRKIRMVRKMYTSTLSTTARSVTARICVPRTPATRPLKTAARLHRLIPSAREVIGLLLAFALMAAVVTFNVWVATR
jgi:hypothetical protein